MNDKKVDDICKSGKMIYCFDIDGTIAKIVSKTKCEPIYEVIEIVNRKFNEGNYIYLYTARNFEDAYRITRDWLSDNGVQYHALKMGKPKAHLYVDDSAVNVSDYIRREKIYDQIFKKRGNKINDMLR